MRAAAWSEISQELGLPADQCKKKWRKLRNCYLNAMNRRQSKDIPKWKFEKEMSFIRPYIETRATQMSMTEPPSHLSVGYTEGGQDEMGSYEHPSPQCDSPEMTLPETSDMILPYNKRKFAEDEDGFANDSPSPSRKKLDTKHRFDETEMFFLSMSETVKRLRPVDQARVKKEIGNLVYGAEIKLLRKREEMEGNS